MNSLNGVDIFRQNFKLQKEKLREDFFGWDVNVKGAMLLYYSKKLMRQRRLLKDLNLFAV